MKLAHSLARKLTFFLALILLSACSGGDGGSSTGSSSENVGNSPSSNTTITIGDYTGTMTFDLGSAQSVLNVNISGNRVTVVSLNDGSASTGSLNGNEFVTEGTINFLFNGQECVGGTRFNGTVTSATSITGTFSSSSANCILTSGEASSESFTGDFIAILQNQEDELVVPVVP